MYNEPTQLALSQVGTASVPKSIHAGHPFRSDKAAVTLHNFVFGRIDRSKTFRDERVKRLVEADKLLFGWLKLDGEDAKRKAVADETGQPFAIQQHMPLALLHLQDKMSYYSGVFAPTNGMFQHVGDSKQQKDGQIFMRVLNEQSQHAGYYKPLMRSIFDLHKYQMGGLITEWETEIGYAVDRTKPEAELIPEIAWQGNRVRAVDLYNSFWMPGVSVDKIADKSEYFATVEPITYYELQRKGMNGEWLNVDEAIRLSTRKKNVSPPTGNLYYKSPPVEVGVASDALSKRGGMWSFMSEGSTNVGDSTGYGVYELLTMWVWLNPYEHNLVVRNATTRAQRNRLELWKLQYVQGKWLVLAEQVINAHAMLPVSLATLNYDALDDEQKSAVEILKPLQDFLSFLLNTHVIGVRNNIWGLTIFDSEIIDLNQLPANEVSGRVPAKPSGADRDLSKAIHRFDNLVDTKQTMQDFQALLGVIQQLMPSQALPSQIAGIDRAVDRQVAAVIQGGNRPLQMGARLIDETLLRNWRTILYFNTVQFQESFEFELDNGEVITVQPEQFQRVGLRYIIGQGLKSLDKQLVAQELQRLWQAILQSQEAMQTIDVVSLIEVWSRYLDIEVDMTQFRKAAPVAVNPGVPTGETQSAAASV